MKAAIEAQADRQFEQARREGTEESPAAYRADAVSALITGKGILGPLGRWQGAAGTAGADCTWAFRIAALWFALAFL